MCGFNLVAFLSAFQLLPTIPFRILALGGTRAEAGWFLAVYTYASAFSAPLTGAIADRIGRRRAIFISCSLFIVFSVAYGFVTSLVPLLVVGCIHGVAWSSMLSSGGAIISEAIPEGRRTEGMAYYGLASTIAVAIAPSIGLFVYGFSWLALCLEMAGLSAVLLLVATRIPREIRLLHRASWHPRELVIWRVVLVAMAMFAVSFGYGGVTSFVALLSQARNIHPESIFFTVFAIAVLFTRIFTSRLGDRFGPAYLLYPTLAMIPPSLLILALSQSRTGVILSATIFGIGFGSAYPAFISFVLGRTDPARRASVFGSVLWAFDTGIGTGSVVTGWVAQEWSFGAAFIVAACFSTLSIPIFAATSRLLGREDQDVSGPRTG